MNRPQLLAGIDAGSVTLKLVISSLNGDIRHFDYRRHRSDPVGCLIQMLEEALHSLGPCELRPTCSGSSGYLVAQTLDIAHLQEVHAASLALSSWAPRLNTAIELGGEDAKIIFFGPPLEQRMNGTCAGGTGAFIDQMAALLEMSPVELDRLAAQTENEHVIASRCGVFAKSDVQGLLARGIPIPEVARSVIKAVVLQTISGLGFGKKICGPLAFLGGPFHFLPTLKKVFCKTLELKAPDLVHIEHDLYTVAYGCILKSQSRPKSPSWPIQQIISQLKNSISVRIRDVQRTLTPLSGQKSGEEVCLPNCSWQEAIPPLSLGLDCGSTTSKICLCDSRGHIVFQAYRDNGASALKVIVAMLLDMYDRIPPSLSIACSGVTGYGEPLLKAALGIELGEVETLAHAEAARALCPDVDAILDIGGQDMKYIRFRNGRIEKIVLNEACSSGCGSFLQTFADSLGLSLKEFCRLGVIAPDPVDLGSRCTVFMNSKIKEAQRDGAKLGDLSAGLAYAVVRNALYKVLKLSSPSELGRRVVVQGGTFLNDAVVRALALESGASPIRPDHPELMGAYGMALLAAKKLQKEADQNPLISRSQLAHFTLQSERILCRGCTNHCQVTQFTFPGGRRYRSGNRCNAVKHDHGRESGRPNLYRYKMQRLFSYTPLPESRAVLGTIGLPRVLNIYEHYPFWFTFLSSLGYRVQLSPPSRRLCLHEGLEYLSSEAICFPAKIVYPHIMSLIKMGIRFVFFPCIPREETPDGSDFRFSCPIVGSFPEVIRSNVDPLLCQDLVMATPFLPLHRRKRLWTYLRAVFPDKRISNERLRKSVKAAYAELDRYRSDLKAEGEKALAWLQKDPRRKGIVLAGRPYHLDGEIHHGIPEMAEEMGVAVISEDALPEMDPSRLQRKLRVEDQWSTHHRLYNAAQYVAHHPQLQMVQLNSFGCGLDAVTTDQVEEILSSGNKQLTLLKIDENSQLGAARIRLRSLLGSPARITPPENNGTSRQRPSPLDREHSLLMPQMSPIHFRYLEKAFNASGYPVEVLPSPGPETVDLGLRHANHDICYPAIIVIGQMIEALQSGRWQPERVTLLMSQTGGGCRASNYVALLELALQRSGFAQIPIITLSGSRRLQGRSINTTLSLTKRIALSQSLGDLEQRLWNRFHHIEPQFCEETLNAHRPDLLKLVESLDLNALGRASRHLCQSFLPLCAQPRRPRVGLVGEIFIKYNSLGNNHLLQTLSEEGLEIVQPDMMGFAEYCAYDHIANHDLLGDSSVAMWLARLFIHQSERIRRQALAGLPLLDPLQQSHHSITELAALAAPLLSTGNQCGEGWYLTAEMAAMLQNGIEHIICVQPFGCLANHISGRGMIKALKRAYPQARVLPLDFDPGSSQVNQYNRLDLFIGNLSAEGQMEEMTHP